MKKYIFILSMFLVLYGCKENPVEYPNVTVKEIITRIDWNGDFDKTKEFFESEFKLEYTTSQFNESGGATTYEFSGGKLFGNETENWITGFLHDKLNAVIIKFKSPEDPDKFYKRICSKINGDIGKNTMELEKSTFWNFTQADDDKLFTVVCNITPNTNDVLVVIKKIR